MPLPTMATEKPTAKRVDFDDKFRREYRDFQSLDDALSNSIMNREFAVTAPDRVTVDPYFGNKTLTQDPYCAVVLVY